MSDINGENSRDDQATSSVIQELAGVADKALVTGDYSRCVAIVENIYELLDRKSGSAAPVSASLAEGK